MDSFMKAAKVGLAKTVAVGQQQLQQRLAKYEQPPPQPQSQSQSQPPSGAYGSAQQYGQHSPYGNKNTYQSSGGNLNQAPYYPPPPTSGHPQQHHSYTPPQHSQDQAYTTQSSPQYPNYAPQGLHGAGNGAPATSVTQEQSHSAATLNGYVQHGYRSPPPLPPRSYQQAVGTGNGYNQHTEYAQATVPESQVLDHRTSSGNQSFANPPLPSQPSGHTSPTNMNNSAPQPQQLIYFPPPPTSEQAHSQPVSNTSHPPNAQYDTSAPSKPSPPVTIQLSRVQDLLSSNINQGTPPITTTQEPPATHEQRPEMNAAPCNYARAEDSLTGGSPYTATYTSPPASTEPTPVQQRMEPNTPAATQYPSIPQYVPVESTTSAIQTQAPLQQDISSIAKDMGDLNINHEQSATATNQSNSASETPRPRQSTPVLASGTPRDVVKYCPEDRVVDYPLFWHHLPDEPEFLICTKCHQDHIEFTPLDSQFKRILAERGSRSTCHFWHPRVKDCLWKQALQSNNLDQLRSFMKRRLTMTNCKGQEAVVGSENWKWFGMRNNEIDGFIACEACYEDKIMGTSFESQFSPREDQGENDKWICDLSLPYITRSIKKFAKENDWASFVANATRRLQLPRCEGEEMAANEGKWYIMRRELEGFQTCAACYMDKLELTAFEHEFEEKLTTGLGFDFWMTMLGQRWTCKIANSNLPMVFALEAKLNDEDFDGFFEATQTISKLVACTKNGIIRGNWWTLSGGCPDYSICDACYTGIFKANGLNKFLEPATRSQEDTIVCSFCPACPRFQEFLGKFVESLDRSVFSYYTDYVRKFASVPACSGIHDRANSTWWGYDQALFCENCFITFVEDTKLGKHLQYYGASDERGQICQIWSPRMRRMWLAACDAGEPGSSESDAELDKFKAFGDKRLQIYNQTVPRIKFIQAMKQMKMMNAMHQGQLSLMYSGMNSTAVLSDTTDGHLHGNSSLGWYETEHGATGAQMFNNMQSGFASANRPDEWVEIMRLQAMWTEVE